MCSRMEEKHRATKCKVEVHYSKSEQWSILGEDESDEDVEKRPFESLTNSLEY